MYFCLFLQYFSDQVFLQWRCSQVAAACVACGRLCCHLLPTWPVSLQATTGYHLQTLSQLMDLLFRSVIPESVLFVHVNFKFLSSNLFLTINVKCFVYIYYVITHGLEAPCSYGTLIFVLVNVGHI